MKKWIRFHIARILPERLARALYCSRYGHEFRRNHTSLDICDVCSGPRQMSSSATPAGEKYPWSGGTVLLASGDQLVHLWKASVKISRMWLSGNKIQWQYIGPNPDSMNWARTKKIHNHPVACVGYMIQRNGHWNQVIGEWVTTGLTYQTFDMFNGKRGDKEFFSQVFEPQNGDEIWGFVCGLVWNGQSNVQERSDYFRMTFL